MNYYYCTIRVIKTKNVNSFLKQTRGRARF